MKIISLLNKNFLLLTCLTFGFLGFSLSFYTLKNAGIGWDSPGDMISAEAFAKLTGNESLQQAYDLIPATSEFYGFFIYQITDFITNSISSNGFNYDYTNFNNYQLLSIVNFLLSLSSIIWMSYVLFYLTKSKIISLIYFVLLQTSPIWIGMQIINYKDTPVAAGVVFLTASCILLTSLENNQFFLHFLGLFFSILGATICFNTRAGALTIIALIIVVFNFIYLYYNQNNFKSKILYLLFFNLFIFFVTYFVTFLLNPIIRINGFRWILDSFQISRNFPSIQPVKAFGIELISNDLPWWYIPSWVFAQNSILLLILLCISVIHFAISLIKKRLNLSYLNIITPSLIIPLFFLFFNLNLYNGIRHILFYLPILYLFIPIFLFKVLNKKHIYFYNFLIFTLIFLNLFDSYRWAPYSYTFINQIAGANSNSRNWDLDYWGVSSREGISTLSNLTPLRPIFVLPDGASSIPFGGVKKTDSETPIPFAMYVYKHWNHNLLPEKCKILFHIIRDKQQLGLGGVCTKN